MTSVLMLAGSITTPSCGSGISEQISATISRTRSASLATPWIERFASWVMRRTPLAAISIPPFSTIRSA
jgi:hypothetical protein